jgi:hypothetical protein
MVKMFTNDPFAMYIYKKHIESIVGAFKKEKRFPCISVGKLISSCNRKNFYGIKDMYDGIEKDYDSESMFRMVMGTILHDYFILSDKSEWHLVYNDVYGHIDEYFPDTKILIEKKTTMQDIPAWKQSVVKTGGERFKWLPGEDWETQLRYYYLLLQKGQDAKTGEPANTDGSKMVNRVYVLHYKPDVEYFFTPMIIPVLMQGNKWEIPFIEEEMMSKKEEIEQSLKNKTVPLRNMSPYKCGYCEYKVRCFYKDKGEGEVIPEEIRNLMGKRSDLAKTRELKA